MLHWKGLQREFCFYPLNLTTVNCSFLIYDRARAFAVLAQQGIWEGAMGVGGMGGSRKEVHVFGVGYLSYCTKW